MAKRKQLDAIDPIAAAVTAAQDSDGTVTLYPTSPVGHVHVPGMEATVQVVDADQAMELLAYMPPAFTLNEDGSSMPEHDALHDAQFEAAWGPESSPPEAEPEQAAVETASEQEVSS